MKNLRSVVVGFLSILFCIASTPLKAQVAEFWSARYQGPGSGTDAPGAIAVDPSGNVVVTGFSMTGGFATEDFTTIKYSPSGDTLWLRRLNGPGGGTDDANAIAIDGEGNVLVTGTSWGTTSAYDYLTVKYNVAGDTLWTRRYNGPHNGGDIANAIAVDAAGNVYVTGESEGTIGTHGIFEDYATVKYSADGDLLWVARYNGPAGDFDAANAIVVDDEGNVVVTGTSDGGSGGSGMPHLDIATIRYDALGTLLWVQRYNGPANANDEGTALGLDAEGNIYVTGNGRDPVTECDITTVRYSPSGDVEWIRVFNGAGNDTDESADLVIDPAGGLFVTGKVYGGSGSGFDLVLIRYEALGDTSWVRTYDGPAGGNDRGIALAMHNEGSVVVTGISSGMLTVEDFTTLKYSSTGDRVWEARYSYDDAAGSSEIPSGVAVDSMGNVFVTGTSALDYTTIMYTETTTGMGSPDAGRPEVFALLQNYPNPFNPTTEIGYGIQQTGNVTLTVYDLLGREVSTLVNERKSVGSYQVLWDATGRPSGAYFYTMTFTSEVTGKTFAETRSLMLLK